jgi:hypothetical protein
MSDSLDDPVVIDVSSKVIRQKDVTYFGLSKSLSTPPDFICLGTS